MLRLKQVVFNSYNCNNKYDNGRPKLLQPNALKFANTQFKFGKAKFINPKIYFDKDIFEFEKFHFFFNANTPIGLTNQFETNTIILSNILNNSLLITQHNDKIGVFHNVCRHRGCALLNENSNKDCISCPYHNWTYGLDGENYHIPYDDYGDNLKDSDLVKLNHYIINNIIFSSLSNKTSLDKLTKALIFLDDYDLVNKVSVIQEWNFSVNANWKILIENYLDVYRLSNTQPLLSRNLHQRDFIPIQSNDFNLGYVVNNVMNSGLIIDLDKTRNFDIRSNDLHDVVHFRLIFPNLFIILFPHHVILFIFEPIKSELTNLKIKLLSKSSNDSHWNTKLIQFYQTMIMKDISICEDMQKGIINSGFNNSFYNKKYEYILYKFHNLLIKEYFDNM